MEDAAQARCTAFEGSTCIASGELKQVILKVKDASDRGSHASLLIFDDASGQPIEVDLRGSADDVLRALAQTAHAVLASTDPGARAPRGPGRPKLGVVAREVTLLPRHWDWLNNQPGGASVTLRKLVEQARRTRHDDDRSRQSREASYRFMSVMAGDRPGFEEATRALFAGERERFDARIAPWPADVRNHTRKLAALAFHERTDEGTV